MNDRIGRRELLFLVERPFSFVERGLLRGGLRGVGVALRARLVEFLGGDDGGRRVAQFLAALEGGLRERQTGVGLGQIFFRFGKRGGFGLAFQFKQKLALFHRVTARDGELVKRTAKWRRDINVFALDVALKLIGRMFRAAAEQRDGEHEPDCVEEIFHTDAVGTLPRTENFTSETIHSTFNLPNGRIFSAV